MRRRHSILLLLCVLSLGGSARAGAPNAAPAAANQSLTTGENTAVAITLHAVDPDGDPLTYAVATPATHGSVTVLGSTATYVPSAGYLGADAFTFTANDGTVDSIPATVTLAVTDIPPVAEDSSATTDEDTAVALPLSASDVELDPLTYGVTQPAHGSVTVSGSTATYVPAPDFNGTDAFTFFAQDGVSASNVATVTVTVVAQPDPPGLPLALRAATPEDTPVTLALAGTDPDGDALTYQVSTPPSHGTVTVSGAIAVYTPSFDFNGTDAFTFLAKDSTGLTSNDCPAQLVVVAVNDAPRVSDGTAQTEEDTAVALPLVAIDVEGDAFSFALATPPSHGTVTLTGATASYTPATDFHGTDAFTVIADDGALVSSPGTLTVTVQPTNDAPVAWDQGATVTEDVAQPVSLEATDVDGDALTYSILAGPAHGTLTGTAPNLTYTPSADYRGADAFTFQANDGTASSNVATVELTVRRMNPALSAFGQRVTTAEDTGLAITLAGSDAGGGAVTYRVSTPPAHGTLGGTAPILTYTPDADFQGFDLFTFVTQAGTDDSAPATVSIEVTPVNDAPLAQPQTVEGVKDLPVSITLVGTDVDGDALSYAVVQSPGHGSLSGTAPDLRYTPDPGFTGEDRFTFQVDDGTVTSATAEVKLTIGLLPTAGPVLVSPVSQAELPEGKITFRWLPAPSPTGGVVHYHLRAMRAGAVVFETDTDETAATSLPLSAGALTWQVAATFGSDSSASTPSEDRPLTLVALEIAGGPGGCGAAPGTGSPWPGLLLLLGLVGLTQRRRRLPPRLRKGRLLRAPLALLGALGLLVVSSGCGSSPPAPPIVQATPSAPDAPTAVSATAGALQATVSWTAPEDDGGNAVIRYTVTASPGGQTTMVAAPTLRATLTEFEAGTAYTFTVVATNGVGDSVPSSASSPVTVTDASPTPLSYSPSDQVLELGRAITAIVPKYNGPPLTGCEISPALPDGLVLGTTDCVLSGTPTALSTTPVAYTVTATTSGGETTASLGLTVNDVPPSNLVYSPAARTCTVHQPLARLTPTFDGGALTACAVSPALPAGLALDDVDCSLSGTPTTVSAATDYTVTASNSGGTTSAVVNLGVNDVGPSLLAFLPNAYVFTRGQAIATILPAHAGGALTQCSVTPAMPVGLSLDPTNCSLTGTPSALSPATDYTVIATNSGGTATTVVRLTVNEVAPSQLAYPASPYVFTLGQALPLVTATHAGGPLTLCTIAPALPSGLVLDSSDCALSGTPNVLAPTPVDYTVTASNSGGTATASLRIAVKDVAPSGLVYAPGAYTLTLHAAIAVITPSVSGGPLTSCTTTPALPSGLTLRPDDCSISGTPTALSDATQYTMTASNSGGSATANVTLTVNDLAPAELTFLPSSYVFTAGQAISPVKPTHGGGPLTSCAITPALPVGLSLSLSDCSLSGTPTALSTTPVDYTVTASNSGGSTTASVRITVNDVAPGIAYAPASYTFTKGEAITPVAPTRTGGLVVSYSIAGALPAGLAFDTATGVISGTPTALQTPPVSYTVTASNSGGSANATVSIGVNDVAPSSLAYSPSTYVFTESQASTTATPTWSGGPLTGCTLTPALPTGLSLSPTDCTISGTPTVLSTSPVSYAVTASNSGGMTTTSVTITVNDVAPLIAYTPAAYTLTKGAAIAVITPTSTGGAVVSYSVTGLLPTGLSLDALTGVISGTPTALQTTPISYTVTATNSGGSADATVSIAVNDVAPSSLAYSPSTYVFTKGQASTTATPTWSGGPLTGCTATPALPTGLSVNPADCTVSGTPTVLSTSPATYTVTAANSGGTTTASVTITVNDVAPVIAYSPAAYTFTKGASMATAAPTSTGGAVVSYSIAGTLPLGLSFDTVTGVLSGTPTVLQTSPVSYPVTATNSGGSATASVTITVNDAAPVIAYSPAAYTFTKGAPTATLAPASTGGAVVSYSVSGTLPTGLTFDGATGIISGTPTALQTTPVSYTVTATNSGGSATASITLTVNDVAPVIAYAPAAYAVTKGAAIAAITPINTGGAVVSYSISGTLPAGLGFDTVTGTISGTPTALQTTPLSCTITATNSGGSSTASVSITVNDAAPVIAYTPASYTFTKGTVIAPITPASTGGAVVSYSIAGALPAGLSFDTATGIISGTPTVLQTPSASYTITATNSGGSTSTGLSIAVNDVLPVIAYTPTAYAFNKGTAIPPITPASTGGAVVSYSIAGTLPAGLSFDTATGVLSGTPTVLQTTPVSYTVTATNSGGTDTATLSIVVKDALPIIAYVPAAYAFTQGTPITAVTPTSTGGAVTSYSLSGALPAGLTFSSFTGVISGTPTVLQTTPVTYTVTASNSGGSTTASVSITVNDVAPSNLAYLQPAWFFTKGQFNSTYAPLHDGGAITGCTSSPALPAGLNLTTTDCTISGAASAPSAATTYTVTATNSGGSTSTSVDITVRDVPPVISYSPSSYVFTQGTAIAPISPTHTGGAVISYSLSGTLPTGLVFDTATGTLSGTPSALQTTTVAYTVTATNSGGSDTATLSLKVVDVPPSNLVFSPSSYTLVGGSPIAAIVPASTGGAITGCTSTPPLPLGLVLGSDCTLSGTPMVGTNPTTYTLTATNSGGSTTAQVTLTVVGPVDPAVSTFTASPAQVVANGTSTVTLTLVAKDAAGHLLTDQAVNFASSETTDLLTPSFGTTDSTTAQLGTTVAGSTVFGTRTFTAQVGPVAVTTAVRYTPPNTCSVPQPGLLFAPAPGSPRSAGIGPVALATGEFNNDGKLDFVSVAQANNQLDTYQGNGDGTFAFGSGLSSYLNAPANAAAGDFNRDGRLDLVTVNSADAKAVVFLKNAGSGYTGLYPITLGGNGRAVAVGDFDRDGSLDLAVVLPSKLQVFLGYGNGTFAAGGTLTLSAGADSIAVGDLNRDGKVDLVVGTANASTSKIYVLRGSGTGGFTKPQTLSVSNPVTTVALGDYDQDGVLDLAASISNSVYVYIYDGLANGTFSSSVSHAVNLGYGPSGVAFGDFNRDGNLDLVASVHSDSQIRSILAARMGDGSGGFSGGSLTIDSDPATLFSAVATGDFDGNGDDDVLISDFDNGKAYVMLSQMASYTPAFRSVSGQSLGGTPQAMTGDDFNQDGKPDLAVIDSAGETLRVMLAYGDGTFALPTSYPVGAAPVALTHADFNRDGKPDLAVANSGSGDVSVLLGSGAGAFDPAIEYAAGTNPTAVASADFDRDGIPDLVVGSADGTVRLLLGTGAGAFAALSAPSAAGVQVSALLTGDLNHDGSVDLTVLDEAGMQVSVLLGVGDGTFQPAVSYPVGAGPVAMAQGDFNRDGAVDLIVANSLGNDVSVLLGAGGGTFGPASSLPAGVQPSSVAVADYNGDGALDLLVGSAGSGNVSLLPGTGTGTFTSASTVATGSATNTVGSWDLNRDGKADITVLSQQGAALRVLLNNGC